MLVIEENSVKKRMEVNESTSASVNLRLEERDFLLMD